MLSLFFFLSVLFNFPFFFFFSLSYYYVRIKKPRDITNRFNVTKNDI